MEKSGENYSLLLLAGGRSSRMGTDKGELFYRGRTFIENLLRKADNLGIEKKYLSGHGTKQKGVQVVQDIYPNRGPLGGLHACMKAMDTRYCLVLPVDVPQIPLEALRTLLDFHKRLAEKGELEHPLLLSHGGRTEPLIGIYPSDIWTDIAEAIRDHPAPVFKVLDQRGYQTFPIEMKSWQAENINTLETYHMVLKQEAGERNMWREITLEHALELIRERAHRIQDVTEQKIDEAGGCVLAEDVFASLDNPPFPRSPVDGYAVRAEDLAGAAKGDPVSLKVAGCIYAGDDGQSFTAGPGEAYRIMTGAPFPQGTDTAVRQEDTDYGEKEVLIYKEQKAWDNYCFQGEDYQKGRLLLKKGTTLTFAEQGILSGLGYTRVRVYRKPVVRIFTTGDELVLPGNPLLPGKIYDSNGIMTGERLKELGIAPQSVEHVGDDERLLAEKLLHACQDADVILTTGGVSVGKKDILHGALECMGAEKVFWRIRLQPGMPTIFSVYGRTLILSLSGNPFGAMANLELLVRPMLEAMTGSERFSMEKREGILTGEFPKKSRVRRFVRAVYREGEVSFPEGIYSSGAIGTLRGCNCLLDIPAGTDPIKKGEKVTVWLL